MDTAYWNPDIAEPDRSPSLIVFTGIMRYSPNRDAMICCLKKIWPIIKSRVSIARLKIIGRHPQKELLKAAEALEDVEITGGVEDIRLEVKGAGLFICPMRFGSGMKNKILESLAMGILVVTTPEGCEGIAFSNGEIGYIGKNGKELADFLVKLISSNEIRNKMSLAAREFAAKKFSWEYYADILSKILSS